MRTSTRRLLPTAFCLLPSQFRLLPVRALLATTLSFTIAFALYSTTAARTITTRYGGTDGGELAATALSGGVAHPSGYPTYMLLARFALLFPFDEPAARLALLSACCGALAVAYTTALPVVSSQWSVISDDEEGTRVPRPKLPTAPASGSPRLPPASALLPAADFWQSAELAGLYAGLALAFGARVWSQAMIVEVYALHLLWLALCALLGLTWLSTGRQLALLAAALCLGLGLGTHLTLLALLPAAALTWAVAPRRPPLPPRLIFGSIAALVAGLSVYGLLPLWASREALPSWGDPRSLGGLWAHISGAEYRYLVGIVPWTQCVGRLSFAARDLLAQPGPLALILALWWGLPHGWQTQRPLLALSGCVAACSLLFAISYGGADGTVYLLPWTWAWCIWAGLGVQAMAIRIGSEPARRRQPWLVPAFLALLVVSLLLPLGAQYRRLNLHADTSQRDRVLAQLAALAPNSLLLTSDDAATFSAWYAQRALGARRDVLVLDTRLLAQPWYRAQVRRQLKMAGDRDVCQVLRESTHPRYIVNADGSVTQMDGVVLSGNIECNE